MKKIWKDVSLLALVLAFFLSSCSWNENPSMSKPQKMSPKEIAHFVETNPLTGEAGWKNIENSLRDMNVEGLEKMLALVRWPEPQDPKDLRVLTLTFSAVRVFQRLALAWSGEPLLLESEDAVRIKRIFTPHPHLLVAVVYPRLEKSATRLEMFSDEEIEARSDGVSLEVIREGLFLRSQNLRISADTCLKITRELLLRSRSPIWKEPVDEEPASRRYEA